SAANSRLDRSERGVLSSLPYLKHAPRILIAAVDSLGSTLLSPSRLLLLPVPAPRQEPIRRPTTEADPMSQHDDLQAELISTNLDFRRLFEEHQEYERRLEALNQKTLLSQDDEVEEKKIKLHKLMLKDQMEQILRLHREAHVSA